MKNFLEPLLAGLIFVIIGIAFLIFPKKIQNYAISTQQKYYKKKYLLSFDSWTRSRYYIISLRIMGLFSTLTALLLLYSLFKK